MPSKTPALCCLLLLICVGLSASIQASTEAKPTDDSTLVMTACTIDKPIAPITGTEEQPGLLRNILDATARDTGIAFKYRYLPWLRCLAEVKHGNIDAVFNITRTVEREYHYAFPDSDDNYLFEAIYGLYLQRGGPLQDANLFTDSGELDIAKYQALRIYGLSAPLGFFTYDALKLSDVSSFPYSIDQGLKLVARGRLDGYVSERLSAWSSGQQQDIRSELIEATVMHQEYEHIAFFPESYQRHQTQIERFWRNLTQHRTRIIGEYLQTREPQPRP